METRKSDGLIIGSGDTEEVFVEDMGPRAIEPW